MIGRRNPASEVTVHNFIPACTAEVKNRATTPVILARLKILEYSGPDPPARRGIPDKSDESGKTREGEEGEEGGIPALLRKVEESGIPALLRD